MSLPPKIAIFGVSPLSLLIGQALNLADHPAVGIYDPDPREALRGSLLLDIAARKRAQQLSPPQASLNLIVLAHRKAAQELQNIYLQDSFIVQLYSDEATDSDWCQAVLISKQPLEDSSIRFELPRLTFRLAGSPLAKEQGARFLSSLSSNFSCLER